MKRLIACGRIPRRPAGARERPSRPQLVVPLVPDASGFIAMPEASGFEGTPVWPAQQRASAGQPVVIPLHVQPRPTRGYGELS